MKDLRERIKQSENVLPWVTGKLSSYDINRCSFSVNDVVSGKTSRYNIVGAMWLGSDRDARSSSPIFAYLTLYFRERQKIKKQGRNIHVFNPEGSLEITEDISQITFHGHDKIRTITTKRIPFRNRREDWRDYLSKIRNRMGYTYFDLWKPNGFNGLRKIHMDVLDEDYVQLALMDMKGNLGPSYNFNLNNLQDPKCKTGMPPEYTAPAKV